MDDFIKQAYLIEFYDYVTEQMQPLIYDLTHGHHINAAFTLGKIQKLIDDIESDLKEEENIETSWMHSVVPKEPLNG